jgi:hypothetical protein
MFTRALGARLIYGFRRRASRLNQLLALSCSTNPEVLRYQFHYSTHLAQP